MPISANTTVFCRGYANATSNPIKLHLTKAHFVRMVQF